MMDNKVAAGLFVCMSMACQDKTPPKGSDTPQSALAVSSSSKDQPSARAPLPSASSSPSQSGVAASSSLPSNSPAPSKLQIVEVREEGDIVPLVRAQRVKALEQGRTLVVYIGAPWCPPCKRFHEAVKSGELDALLSKTTILWFDLDKDQDRLLQAGYGSKFIPFFVLPGPDGRKADALEIKTLKKEEAMGLMREGLVKWQK